VNLYLLRHSTALDLGEHGIQTDEERPLSEEGIQRVASLADALKRRGISFDHVLTSPLRRSVQTAEELVRLLGSSAPVTVCESLAPGGTSKKLAKLLLAVEGGDVVLVGHEPDLGRHAAWLIGSKKAQLEFAKCGLACIRCDGAARKGTGTLAWLVTPKWLG
jgi:phosphohistidine phosphatase